MTNPINKNAVSQYHNTICELEKFRKYDIRIIYYKYIKSQPHIFHLYMIPANGIVVL